MSVVWNNNGPWFVLAKNKEKEKKVGIYSWLDVMF